MNLTCIWSVKKNNVNTRRTCKPKQISELRTQVLSTPTPQATYEAVKTEAQFNYWTRDVEGAKDADGTLQSVISCMK